jgi:hypothetical protein
MGDSRIRVPQGSWDHPEAQRRIVRELFAVVHQLTAEHPAGSATSISGHVCARVRQVPVVATDDERFKLPAAAHE